MFTSGSSQVMRSSAIALERGMECPSLLFRRGKTRQEHFVPLLLGDQSNLCAPRISQMSPREGWEGRRAGFSASPARTLASSLSFIFIRVRFPPGNSYQSVQPARLLAVGTGPELHCPPSSRRTWCVAGKELWESEGKHMTRGQDLFNDTILFLIRAYSRLGRRAKIRLQEEFWS